MEYNTLWPDHCQTCRGSGAGVGQRQSRETQAVIDPCPDCTEQGICPCCGKPGLTSEKHGDDSTGKGPCAYCQWDYGMPDETTVYGAETWQEEILKVEHVLVTDITNHYWCVASKHIPLYTEALYLRARQLAQHYPQAFRILRFEGAKPPYQARLYDQSDRFPGPDVVAWVYGETDTLPRDSQDAVNDRSKPINILEKPGK